MYKRYIPPTKGTPKQPDPTTTDEPPSKRRRNRTQDEEEEDDPERLRKFSGVIGKFQKSTQLSQKSRSSEGKQPRTDEPVDESKVVRDLVLPLPEKATTPAFQPHDFSLPAWLAKPTIFTSEGKRTFADLGLPTPTVERLSRMGFVEALPVQQAVLPTLLPPIVQGSQWRLGSDPALPDLVVEAATGSGKTIAYLLPVIEGVKREPYYPGKLQGLVVVPTTELAKQVAKVAKSLAEGSRLKVGTITTSTRFKDEQQKLIVRRDEWDPVRYSAYVDRANRHCKLKFDPESDEYQLWRQEIRTQDAKTEQRVYEAARGLPNHVPVYDSAFDVLIATPGRLLEHLEYTLGFNLVHVRMLVIDEVDKLLDNQFRGFLSTLNTEIHRARTYDEQDPIERCKRSVENGWDDRFSRWTRRAVFSATMTRNLSKLMTLRLSRPQMIVVRNSADSTSDPSGTGTDDGLELPISLLEYCVPVGDGSEKPLLALQLLESRILADWSLTQPKNSSYADQIDDTSDEDSDSDSDSSSDDTDSSLPDDRSSVSSDDSTSSRELSTSSDEVMDETSEEASAEMLANALLASTPFVPPYRSAAPETAPQATTVLIFTSSNESASRLSHVLKCLKPAWAPFISTLIKTDTNRGARFHRKAHEPAIVVSTDRASRGLDSFGDRPFTHVIQYDVPRSLNSYVHRVGRTARAGRNGDAWTLYTHSEGRWFDNEILKSKIIRRPRMVERVKLERSDKRLRRQFAEIVGGMKEEVRKA